MRRFFFAALFPARTALRSEWRRCAPRASGKRMTQVSRGKPENSGFIRIPRGVQNRAAEIARHPSPQPP